MLRGNSNVRIDEKGRIKVPATYRQVLEEHYGHDFYITSLNGECARIYPMREWLTIEEKLRGTGTMNGAVKKFLDRTNYFGQMADMDSQGRLLIHPLLRTSADLSGEVAVLGFIQYLEVWSVERFKARVLSEPYTTQDEEEIARLGV